MAAKKPGVASRIDRDGSTAPIDLVRTMESKTETITGAVASGAVTLEELDRFVRRVERGEVDCCDGTDAVVRIVRSLLSDRRPSWEEMEPAGRATGA
ncbi:MULTISPECIES: hypothetical protein [unclassified Halorubrum]|uniref:hypothetical protein n=1 Tax=unclassified Halorubrum TaxID=2642239 RepID=UPI000B98E7C6|nr:MULTISPECIES: hypothetical protein [unclassified Halorubrum]OYR46109.1 hypothetical protein DJ81_03365 [Halorubrum sp. Hd13]OYR48898.1 hypothetical protein DJ75_02110 [Halorubrum sp. Eb13]OYR50686.1 hypothetical protein DJ73_15450 [Halorubrum sp. Ea1]OYR51853.1 hypothetical protein DJ74_02980 [Halorubrum sp. Ea8]